MGGCQAITDFQVGQNVNCMGFLNALLRPGIHSNTSFTVPCVEKLASLRGNMSDVSGQDTEAF